MPFAQRARVYLRNDTDRNLSNYSFVEWEPLPAWDARLGYFHATYDRRSFQLTPENWRQLSYDLGAFAGKEVAIVVKISYGGKLGMAMNEEAFLDEFSVR